MNKAAIAIVAWIAIGLEIGLRPALELVCQGFAHAISRSQSKVRFPRAAAGIGAKPVNP